MPLMESDQLRGQKDQEAHNASSESSDHLHLTEPNLDTRTSLSVKTQYKIATKTKRSA
jgi:hypothetical protein